MSGIANDSCQFGIRSLNGVRAVELIEHSPDAVLPPTFGASLRAARLSRNMTLDEVATRTKINVAFLRDLERNDLSKWPASQFYRESYLRAYARAVGLDPGELIESFRRESKNGDESSAARPPARPRRLTPVTIPIILAVTFALSYALARWLAPSSNVVAPAVNTPSIPAAVETTQPSAIETPALRSSAAPFPAAAAAPARSDARSSIELPAPPAEATSTAGSPLIAGELSITSVPDGARVLVNGINRGVTPLTLQGVPAGAYSVRLILPGRAGVTRHATISAQRPQAAVSVEFDPPSVQE